ncbi:MAG: sugar phosphate nucleotidyltransferase [Hyphomonadaceae bacterium]|nr:sugar phosphate nucleotidyltransferase [Hyphomonadaceae bacterium]
MKHRIIPVILSGGSGTRLWPASTDDKPKQFHALGGSQPLIAETVERVRGETDGISFGAPIIICSARHAELTAKQMAEIGVTPAAIVLEPFGRNTAAAGAIAAALTAEIEPGALALLLPADHVIQDRAGFLAVIERAAAFAKERILTFGIAPNRPETGYGYIKRGEPLDAGVFKIESFREKPNAETAQQYLDDGGYSWNAGMFMFDPSVMLREFEPSAAIRDGALAALKQGKRDGAFITLDAEAFEKTPSQPLDIAVMEKTRLGAVAPCDIGWADVGSWDEIWRLAPHDDHGNAKHGPAVALDASGNLLRTDGPKICVAGVDNLIVVASGDAVVILPRARAQDVKLLRELALKLN